MGSADGVAAHILEQLQLMAKGRFVYRGPEGTQVVMVADAPEFTRNSVEEESLSGDKFDGSDAENGLVRVTEAGSGPDPCDRLVERRAFRAP